MDQYQIIGVPSAEFSEHYSTLTAAGPVPVSSAFVYLSRPLPSKCEVTGLDITLRVGHHANVYNVAQKRVEFLIFLDDVDGQNTLRDLGLSSADHPYFRLAWDPMTSRASRLWLNSVGNSLHGKTVPLTLSCATITPWMKTDFNPVAYESGGRVQPWAS